jgi:hypothetical protein
VSASSILVTPLSDPTVLWFVGTSIPLVSCVAAMSDCGVMDSERNRFIEQGHRLIASSLVLHPGRSTSTGIQHSVTHKRETRLVSPLGCFPAKANLPATESWTWALSLSHWIALQNKAQRAAPSRPSRRRKTVAPLELGWRGTPYVRRIYSPPVGPPFESHFTTRKGTLLHSPGPAFIFFQPPLRAPPPHRCGFLSPTLRLCVLSFTLRRPVFIDVRGGCRARLKTEVICNWGDHLRSRQVDCFEPREPRIHRD